MESRSNQVVGMVNFPVDSEEYTSTNEGGMFVQLWCVEEDYLSADSWWYHDVYANMSETLLGTDSEVNEDNFHEIEEGKDPMEWEQRFTLEEMLFPRIKVEGENQYLSKELVACVTMGSTGWSGANEKNEYWRCRYEDLNDSGKGIYDALKNAYPKAKLILVTWLDT
jgi:hypothetical protein